MLLKSLVFIVVASQLLSFAHAKPTTSDETKVVKDSASTTESPIREALNESSLSTTVIIEVPLIRGRFASDPEFASKAYDQHKSALLAHNITLDELRAFARLPTAGQEFFVDLYLLALFRKTIFRMLDEQRDRVSATLDPFDRIYEVNENMDEPALTLDKTETSAETMQSMLGNVTQIMAMKERMMGTSSGAEAFFFSWPEVSVENEKVERPDTVGNRFQTTFTLKRNANLHNLAANQSSFIDWAEFARLPKNVSIRLERRSVLVADDNDPLAFADRNLHMTLVAQIIKLGARTERAPKVRDEEIAYLKKQIEANGGHGFAAAYFDFTAAVFKRIFNVKSVRAQRYVAALREMMFDVGYAAYKIQFRVELTSDYLVELRGLEKLTASRNEAKSLGVAKDNGIDGSGMDADSGGSGIEGSGFGAA